MKREEEDNDCEARRKSWTCVELSLAGEGE